ncbi:MAG: YsnF/AvaK domain-containing protein, partial [Pseudomonadota bacterium]|nr:YsnF/AvaK domain-containing protein [Pseudomonadota bacterium]
EAGATHKLQEVEEELHIGKRAVARGGVRIFTRMTEVPVEESVRLREEHADVQRRTVDRPATEADLAAFKEGSIEVREMAEEAVVSKSARVVGEVEVGKTATERDETVRDTVRKTKVDVEQIDGGSTTGVAEGQGRPSTFTGGGSDTATRSATDLGVRTTGSANRDSLSGELGAHPVGTGVGAAAGGIAAGAAAGSVAGPVGTAVGAAVGAVAGGLAGKGVAEEVDPTTPRDDGKKI